MATFNPSAGGVPSANMPDQTGASRGAIPNRAFESLFEGAGALVKGAITAVDDLNKYNITEEVKAGWGKVNEPFDPDSLPKDLTDSAATMKSLQTAYDQGKLSDVYYTGQLASMTKKLRSQYPQYDQYIDQTVQNITGIRPANAFRTAVLNEFEQQAQDASDQQKADAKWIDDNAADIYRVNANYFNDPSSYDLGELKRQVYVQQGKDGIIKADKAKLEYEASLGQATDERTIEVASQSLGLITSSMINNTANGLKIGGDNLFQQIQELAKGGFTPQEAEMLGPVLTQMRATLESQIEAEMANPLGDDPYGRSFNDMLDPSKTEALKKRAMEPLDTLIKYANDDKWGMFTYNASMVQAMNDAETARILRTDDKLVTANALSEISQPLADAFLQENGGYVGVLANIAPEAIAGVVTGARSWGEVVTDMANSRKSAADKAGGINSMVDLGQTAILSEDTSDQEFSNVVNSIYSPDEDGSSVFSYIKAEEFPSLFSRMYNADITEAILSRGTPDEVEMYYESATEIFSAMPSFVQSATGMKNDAEQAKQLMEPIQFSFNPDMNRFIVSMDPNGYNIEGQDPADMRKYLETKFIKGYTAVNDLNAGLAILTPMMEGIGLSKEEQTAEIKRLVSNLNLDLENGDFGLFGELYNSMGNATDEQGTASEINVPEDFSFNLKEANAASSETITSTIMGFEGYRDTAYWDVNSYRTGFGSDTITSADGTVSKVTPGSQITREDAHRDLARRLNEEFIPEIQQDIGVDTWSNLSESTQAALASIAYNYGSLPAKVSRAAKSGDLDALKQAILALQGQNGGVNDARRAKEASMIN